MKIRYVGPGVRIIEQYRWDDTNGKVVDVIEADLAANLLTYPYPQFELVNDEPLLMIDGIGPQTAAELALAGVATINQLAALKDPDIRRVADSIHGSQRQVKGWVKQARARPDHAAGGGP